MEAPQTAEGVSQLGGIVYDRAYMECYAGWIATYLHESCAFSVSRVITPTRVVSVIRGPKPLGHVFDTADLTSFLAARASGEFEQRTIHIDAKLLGKRQGMMLDRSPYDDDVCTAINLLGETRQTSALPIYAALLDDPEPRVRIQALEALAQLSPSEPKAVAEIAARLDDEEHDVARAAAKCLAKSGNAALPAILAALKTGDAAMRRRVVLALPYDWPRADGSPASAILAALRHEDGELREAAVAYVIDEIQVDGRQAGARYVIPLLTHLNDRRCSRRIREVMGLMVYDQPFDPLSEDDIRKARMAYDGAAIIFAAIDFVTFLGEPTRREPF